MVVRPNSPSDSVGLLDYLPGLTPTAVFCHHFVPTAEPPQGSARPSCDGTSRDQEKGGPAALFPRPRRGSDTDDPRSQGAAHSRGPIFTAQRLFLKLDAIVYDMPGFSGRRDVLPHWVVFEIFDRQSMVDNPPLWGGNPRSPLTWMIMAEPYGLQGSSGSRVPTS